MAIKKKPILTVRVREASRQTWYRSDRQEKPDSLPIAEREKTRIRMRPSQNHLSNSHECIYLCFNIIFNHNFGRKILKKKLDSSMILAWILIRVRPFLQNTDPELEPTKTLGSGSIWICNHCTTTEIARRLLLCRNIGLWRWTSRLAMIIVTSK